MPFCLHLSHDSNETNLLGKVQCNEQELSKTFLSGTASDATLRKSSLELQNGAAEKTSRSKKDAIECFA